MPNTQNVPLISERGETNLTLSGNGNQVEFQGAYGVSDKMAFEMQNIKEEKITAEQLDALKSMTGSFESLFSRRALKYKEMGLKNKKLEEKDYRELILKEYTFLKRPVIIMDNKIFVGSEKKNLAELKTALSE